LPIVFAVLVFGLTSSLQEAYAGNGNEVLSDCEKSSELLIGPFALASQNSVLIIDPCDLDDMPWTLNEGASHLAGQELFICEIVDGVCIDVGPLDHFTVAGSFFSGDELFINYRNFAQGVSITVTWELIGGEPGSNDSTLNETIEIFRITEGTSTYRFFQETDFDLADTSTNTFVQIGSTFAQQENSIPSSGPRMKGTVSVNPSADAIMVGEHDEVVEEIIGFGELDGTAGPFTDELDYVFGFSWDFDISPGREGKSFKIEKTKRLEPLGDKNVLSIEGGHPFIHTIDAVTARTISSVEITLDGSFSKDLVVNGGTGIAFNPVDRIVYALLSVSDDPGSRDGPKGTGGGKTRHLATIDPQTGIATLVGDTGVKKIASLTFDSGTLFSVNLSAGGSSTGTLSTISTVDGSVTNLCDLDTNDGTGLAFNPNDGLLYYTTDGTFQRINNFNVEGSCDVTELSTSPINPSALVFFNSFLIVDGESELSSITDAGDDTTIGFMDHFSRDLAVITPTSTGGGGGPNEPPTIGKNRAGTNQVVENGICIDANCWTVTENFHVDFELVQLFTSEHTISNTIYCANGVDKCKSIILTAGPYHKDSKNLDEAIWKVTVDRDFEDKLTVTVDDPDDHLGDVTCTAQIIDEKYWGTSCTIDFLLATPGGFMLGIELQDSYGANRYWYFNDGIEIIDTYGYPSVDTEFEQSLDVPRLCLSDNPDKRTSCAFAKKMQLEIERAERLLAE